MNTRLAMGKIKILTKCCICGRVKTGNGWQAAFSLDGAQGLYSHGICSNCYDFEVLRIKNHCLMPATVAAR